MTTTPTPVRGTILPLEWHDCQDGTSHDNGCQYEIEQDGKYWLVIRATTGPGGYVSHAPTREAAKAAAQADYEARILAAIQPDPEPQHSVPTVRQDAVEALARYRQADMDGVMVLVSRQAVEECLPALRALGGERE